MTFVTCLAAYRYSWIFPRAETHGLLSQLGHAAVSRATNITGWFRKRRKQTPYAFGASHKFESKNLEPI
jgi:hypothetical protein